MASGVAQVQQTPFRQQNNPAARRHLDHINLFFDIGPFVVLQVCHLNFIVKVTNVSNNRHILHLADMFDADNVFVAGGGDKYIGAVDHIFQQHDLKAIHRRLQGTDWIHFGHFYPRACAPQRGR